MSRGLTVLLGIASALIVGGLVLEFNPAPPSDPTVKSTFGDTDTFYQRPPQFLHPPFTTQFQVQTKTPFSNTRLARLPYFGTVDIVDPANGIINYIPEHDGFDFPWGIGWRSGDIVDFFTVEVFDGTDWSDESPPFYIGLTNLFPFATVTPSEFSVSTSRTQQLTVIGSNGGEPSNGFLGQDPLIYVIDLLEGPQYGTVEGEFYSDFPSIGYVWGGLQEVQGSNPAASIVYRAGSLAQDDTFILSVFDPWEESFEQEVTIHIEADPTPAITSHTTFNPTQADFCRASRGSAPAQHIFTFDYIDGDGDAQDLVFQVAPDGDFSTPHVDITSSVSDGHTGTKATNAVYRASKQGRTDDQIDYGLTYQWRAKVRDEVGNESQWYLSDIPGVDNVIETPVHPYPKVDFLWHPDPVRLQQDAIFVAVNFEGLTESFSGSQVMPIEWLRLDNGEGKSDIWDPPWSTEIKAFDTEFTSKGSFPIRLKATDSTGYECVHIQPVLVSSGFPVYDEAGSR